jgi:DNA-binding NarL/FixJ family response regulator
MVFAEALAIRLAREAGLQVVGAVSRASHALALLANHRVTMVLMGQRLDGMDGVELARRLRALDDPPLVVVLGETDLPRDVAEALGAGVQAWVEKDSPVDLLLQVIQAVSCGQRWLPPHLLGPVLDLLLIDEPQAAGSALEGLTPRELEVLRCMVEGLGQNAIAQRLYVSPNTVRTHRRRTLAKLGVHSSLEAVAAARRAGIVVGSPGAAQSEPPPERDPAGGALRGDRRGWVSDGFDAPSPMSADAPQPRDRGPADAAGPAGLTALSPPAPASSR